MSRRFSIGNVHQVTIYTGPDITDLERQTRSLLPGRRRRATQRFEEMRKRFEIVLPTAMILLWAEALKEVGHRDPLAGMMIGGGGTDHGRYFHYLDLLKKHVNLDTLRELCSPELWNDKLSPEGKEEARQHCKTQLLIYAQRFIDEQQTKIADATLSGIAEETGAQTALDLAIRKWK